jgi:hypothetical protein
MLLITLNSIVLLGLAGFLVAHTTRKQEDPPVYTLEPAKVYSNLPDERMVNNHIRLASWQD